MHPNEDHPDLRPHGQTMLDLSSWTIPRNKRDRSSLDNESENEVEEEGNAPREKKSSCPPKGGEVNRVVPSDYEMECDEYTNRVSDSTEIHDNEESDDNMLSMLTNLSDISISNDEKVIELVTEVLSKVKYIEDKMAANQELKERVLTMNMSILRRLGRYRNYWILDLYTRMVHHKLYVLYVTMTTSQ